MPFTPPSPDTLEGERKFSPPRPGSLIDFSPPAPDSLVVDRAVSPESTEFQLQAVSQAGPRSPEERAAQDYEATRAAGLTTSATSANGLTVPIIQLPAISREAVQAVAMSRGIPINQDTAEVVAGGINVVGRGASAMTSPLGIATVALAPLGAPALLTRAVSAGFAAQMAHDVVGPMAEKAGTASVTGDLQEKVEAYGDVLLTSLFAAAAAKHAEPFEAVKEVRAKLFESGQELTPDRQAFLDQLAAPATEKLTIFKEPTPAELEGAALPLTAKVAEEARAAEPIVPRETEAPTVLLEPPVVKDSLTTESDVSPSAEAPRTSPAESPEAAQETPEQPPSLDAEKLAEQGDPIAKQIARGYNQLPLDEALAAANTGLDSAVKTFDPAKGSFEDHVTTSVYNALHDALRKNNALKRGGGVEKVSLQSDLPGDTGQQRAEMVADEQAPNPSNEAGRADVRQRIAKAKEGLELQHRTALQAIEDGANNAELARRLRVSPPTAQRILRQALKALQEAASLTRDDMGVVYDPALFVRSALELPIIKQLNNLREGISNLFKTSATHDIIAARSDAASNQARIAGRQAGNRVRLLIEHEKLDDPALSFVIEANGSLEKLKADALKIKGKGYDNVMARAIQHFDRLNKVADEVRKIHDQEIDDERASGIEADKIEAYLAHRYDFDLSNGGRGPIVLDATGGRGSGSTFFKKQRVFPDYASAIEAGYKPKTLDASKLVEHRIAAGQQLINQRAWAHGLRNVIDPLTGKPVVVDLITQPKGTKVPPRGYVYRELVPGSPIAISESLAPVIDALIGSSHFPKLLVKSAGFIKHGFLLLDTFHASRVMQKQLFMTGRIGYERGRALLEYSETDLAEAVRQGEIAPEMADYARQNRPKALALIKEGLNVGQISDALYRSVITENRLFRSNVGKFNEWVFGKLTRGAMLETGIWALEKNRAAFPELTEDQIIRKTAKETNEFFGNLGSQGIFRSATWRDTMRFVFLAPQWVESMARTEAKGFGQIGAIPVDLARGRGARVGMMGRAMATGIAAYLVAGQLINLATTGHPTWENPEGHKLDTFVPDVIQKSSGYWLSPLAIPAELTHDVVRYHAMGKGPLDIGGKIMDNKLGPFAHAFITLKTGKDFFGRPLDGTWGRVKEAALQAAPIPLPARSAIASYKGSAERQLLGSAGFKVEPVASASADIGKLANAFREKKGIPHRDFGASDYLELNRALLNHDLEGAQKAYDNLKAKGKLASTMEKYYTRAATAPFTHNNSMEAEFYTSLNRDQLDSYNKAKLEKGDMAKQFLKLKK